MVASEAAASEVAAMAGEVTVAETPEVVSMVAEAQAVEAMVEEATAGED